MKKLTSATTILLGAFLLLGHTVVHATVIFTGPTPYLSDADIPAGFYLGGSPIFLEDFEDGTLDGGISVNAGFVGNPGDFRDSVDADDGAIDGSGTGGHSFVSRPTDPDFILFTFSGPLPTAAGLVWTDANSGAPDHGVTFEAFGAGMVSLGSIGPFDLDEGLNTGQTAEDRFFGVQYLGGILAIKITDIADNFEVDHVQYGYASVPEPSTLMLLGIALLALGFLHRRKVV